MEPRRFKRIKRFLVYLLVRALHALVGLLPLSVARSLGGALGRLGFRLAGGERRKALASLEVAFPGLSAAERFELARRSFESLGVCGGEIGCLRRIAPQLTRYVELSDEDAALVKSTLSEGKGVLFFTGHVGNFELMAQRFAALGFPSHTIASPAKDPRMTAYLEKLRGNAGVLTIWRGRGTAISQMEAALDRNEVVGLLIDQDTRTHGVWVDFFGRPAFTPRIVSDLALRRGTPVMSSFVFRRPDGGHRMRLARLQPPAPTGDFDEDSRAFTQRMSDAIEQAIREAPHTWVWLHQRWKTKPPQANQAAAKPADAAPRAAG